MKYIVNLDRHTSVPFIYCACQLSFRICNWESPTQPRWVENEWDVSDSVLYRLCYLMGEDVNPKKHRNLTVFSKEFTWLKNIKLNELAKFLRRLGNDYVTQSHFIKNYVDLI